MATAGRLIDTSVFAGASAAYSLRIPEGSPYNGPLIRVRRTSDNTEQDINAGPADGNGNRWIDQAALLAFCGASSGRVATWYDRSGFGRHATQPTAGLQPLIVNAGVVEIVEGRPCIVGSGPLLSPSIPKVAHAAMFNVVLLASNNQNRNILSSGDDSWINYLGDPYPQLHQTDRSFVAIGNMPSVGRYIYSQLNTTVNHASYVNGAFNRNTPLVGSYRTSAQQLALHTYFADISPELLYFQGFISDSKRLALERNQGIAFGITVA